MTAPVRRRLDHIDAMRPIKQAGVVATHSVIFFAPAVAGTASGAALRHFYWRRLLAVGIPYLCWNFIYFLYLLPTAHYANAPAALRGLGDELEFGDFQLYFLVVIMQFYVVAPLVIALLRRTRGHHGLIFAAAVLAQLTMAVLTQLHLLPGLIPFNIGLIACGYLAGIALVLAVAIVALCCVPLTELLARTPLAGPLTGRKRVPWRRPERQPAAQTAATPAAWPRPAGSAALPAHS